MKRLIKHLWHELYYLKAGKSRVEFGMNCREVTGHIDLRSQPKTLLQSLRINLHLSFCQACADYDRFSKGVRSALKKSEPLSPSIDLAKLNKDLADKFLKEGP